MEVAFREARNEAPKGTDLQPAGPASQRAPERTEHRRCRRSTCKRQLIPLLNLLLSDEVGTSVTILHQCHCPHQFASPIDIILIEAAHVQDHLLRPQRRRGEACDLQR